MARHTLTANVDDFDFQQALELVHHLNTSRSDMIRKLVNSAHRELISRPWEERIASAQAAGGDEAAREVRAKHAEFRRAASLRPAEPTFQERAAERRRKRGELL